MILMPLIIQVTGIEIGSQQGYQHIAGLIEAADFMQHEQHLRRKVGASAEKIQGYRDKGCVLVISQAVNLLLLQRRQGSAVTGRKIIVKKNPLSAERPGKALRQLCPENQFLR